MGEAEAGIEVVTVAWTMEVAKSDTAELRAAAPAAPTEHTVRP